MLEDKQATTTGNQRLHDFLEVLGGCLFILGAFFFVQFVMFVWTEGWANNGRFLLEEAWGEMRCQYERAIEDRSFEDFGWYKCDVLVD